MDTHKKIAKALVNKSFAEAKELIFKSLYAKASLALDEARFAVANAVFNEATEQLDEVSPPDMEKMTGSKKTKASFAKQYGKRGKSVMYATAWKLHNKKMAEGYGDAGTSEYSKFVSGVKDDFAKREQARADAKKAAKAAARKAKKRA